jgi:hypothetical protein
MSPVGEVLAVKKIETDLALNWEMTSAFTDVKQLKESRLNILFFKRCPANCPIFQVTYSNDS